jgi:hypothetical protein
MNPQDEPASDAPASSDAYWHEKALPDGKVYYFNALTKQTTWQKPAALQTLASSAPSESKPTSS